MITSLSITNFKGIEQENLELRPLTVLTGLNSTGKSTCLQSILCTLYYSRPNASILLNDMGFDFQSVRNKNVNAKQVDIVVTREKEDLKLRMVREVTETTYRSDTKTDLETDIFYLNANRLAFSDIESLSEKYKIGIAGEYVFGTYELEKSNPVVKPLRCVSESDTLASHVNYWLSYILGLRFEMTTEKVLADKVKVLYKSNGLSDLSPRHLGVGVSYLAKVLIACLRAKPGDVLMIENPEIHLHPAAQSRLGHFFCYIVKAGIQLIIETHCEHMLNRIRYEIFEETYPDKDFILYYKRNMEDPFIRIVVDEFGDYTPSFPKGFFDATLNELLEIG